MIEQSNKCCLFGFSVAKEIYDAYATRSYPICRESVSFSDMLRYASSGFLDGYPEHQKEARAMIAKLKEEVAEFIESGRKMCPMTFASAEPRKCREDCAWFVTPEGWGEGCCAIAATATCIRNIDDSLNGEGIYSELNAISCTLQNANATP